MTITVPVSLLWSWLPSLDPVQIAYGYLITIEVVMIVMASMFYSRGERVMVLFCLAVVIGVLMFALEIAGVIVVV